MVHSHKPKANAADQGTIEQKAATQEDQRAHTNVAEGTTAEDHRAHTPKEEQNREDRRVHTPAAEEAHKGAQLQYNHS